MTNQAGKGSTRRPRDSRCCTEKQYAERFAAIKGFAKPKTKPKTKEGK